MQCYHREKEEGSKQFRQKQEMRHVNGKQWNDWQMMQKEKDRGKKIDEEE